MIDDDADADDDDDNDDDDGGGGYAACPGIVWEPIRKRAHTKLVREHSVTVGSDL